MQSRAERVERFFSIFSDEAVRLELEKLRWPRGMKCPACGLNRTFSKTTRVGAKGESTSGYYVCPGKTSADKKQRPRDQMHDPVANDSGASRDPRRERRKANHQTSSNSMETRDEPLIFTVRTGTILVGSHIPLSKWVCALALRKLSRNTITATELSELLGISRKSAGIMRNCMNDLYRDSQGREASQKFLRVAAIKYAERLKAI